MFEQKCNVIEMSRRGKGAGSGGGGGGMCVRGPCIPTNSLKAVGSWKRKTRVMSLIKTPVGPSTSGGKEEAWPDDKHPNFLH